LLKGKPMALVGAFLDSREPDWVKKLTFGGVSVATVLLDAGDLQLATDDGSIIVVERKTATDFLNTLKDDRLFPQMAKIREASPWCYLALCGVFTPSAGGKCFINGIESGWNWASVQHALLTIQELGVNILNIASDHDYEASIIRLANRDRSTKKVSPPRDLTITDPATVFLASLPGIGPDRATALLQFCGTPANALHFLSDDSPGTKSLPGIGPMTKAKVRATLGLDDAEILHAVDRAGLPRVRELGVA
jgi:ERCC4-type nuclease